MPRLIPALLLALLGGSAGLAQAEDGHRRTFVSPMGEPFHGTDAAPDPERAWFAAADTNGDGVLTRAEFQADASRFFARLDRGHDGEIDPGDIDVYENQIAPEVRSGSGGGYVMSGSGTDGSPKAPVYDAGKLGAARFSYYDLPEPVTAADRNFNRGIDAREFADAADHRFDALDKRHDGKLTWDELPHVSGRAAGPDRRGGGRGQGRGGHGGGGHHRGGYGGGSFGGGAMGGMGGTGDQ